MATKNNPGAFDCYANAEPDEPMFVLLGRDKHAPTLVWLWATLRELDQEDPKKVAEARDCVAQMIAWAVSKGKKPVGIGQAVLAGTMDLIRMANAAIVATAESNDKTTVETLRAMLSHTTFEGMEDVVITSKSDAMQRAGVLLVTDADALPVLAKKYAAHMVDKIGQTSHTLLMAFAHYAQAVENLACDEEEYMLDVPGREWFEAEKSKN